MRGAKKQAAGPPKVAKPIALPAASSLLWSQHDRLTAIADYAHAVSLCIMAIETAGNSERDACAIGLIAGHIQEEAEAVSDAIKAAGESINAETRPALLKAITEQAARPKRGRQ